MLDSNGWVNISLESISSGIDTKRIVFSYVSVKFKHWPSEVLNLEPWSVRPLEDTLLHGNKAKAKSIDFDWFLENEKVWLANFLR